MTNKSAGFRLRPYQCDGVRKIYEALSDRKWPLVSVATGGGKSTMIAKIVSDSIVTSSRRILILAHTEEIIHQLANTVRRFTDVPVGVVVNSFEEDDKRVVVASRQSLNEKRIRRLLSFGTISMLIIDEAHHATSQNSYGRIAFRLSGEIDFLHVIGFTATPRDSAFPLFSGVVFTWSVDQGVNDKVLVPIREIRICISEYSSPVGVSVVDVGLTAYFRHCYLKRSHCMAFFDNVQSSLSFTSALQRLGVPAFHIDGQTDKVIRHRMLKLFREGVVSVMSNVAVLTEGLDIPNVDSILLARLLRSESLLNQILGRGIRSCGSKEDCLLVRLVD